MSQSLYRKYRPQVFSDVVGQDHIIKTLKNSIEANKVSHAYLFCGPRGTGKTTTARILAKALLCENGPTTDPDGSCEDCKLISQSRHPDVFELDAASRTGVDNVRDEIISRVGYAPVRGNFKVYIIDEVHMLSVAAFNALLKTIEEPPDHIVFVLCTTDPQKVPETIRSRCQRFDFRPINTEQLTSRLGAVCEMEGVEFEGDALDLIARRANGGLRDALTALEQTIAFSGEKVSLDVVQDMFGKTQSSDLNVLVEAIAKRDINSALSFVDDKLNDGVDLAQFIDDLAVRLRDVYVVKLTNCDIAIQETACEIDSIKREANLFDEAQLKHNLSITSDLCRELRIASNQRLVFELGLFKMLETDRDDSLKNLEERISELEKNIISRPILKKAGDTQSNLVATNNAVFSEGENEKIQSSNVDNTNEVKSDSSQKQVNFKSIWESALGELKTSSPEIYGLLESTHGRFNKKEKIITINLEQGRKFALTNLSKPASKTAIISALEKAGLFGATIKVEMIESSENDKKQDVRFDEIHIDNTSEPQNEFENSFEQVKQNEDEDQNENIAENSEIDNAKKNEDGADVAQLFNEESEQKTSEIDEFNEILSSTFGQGAAFHEVN